MEKSSLATSVVEANASNYTSGRKGYKISKITPHHMASVLTATQCGKIFQSANRNASANYGIGNDGGIALYVDETNRAWTSSSVSNDCQAITIEVSNSSVGGDYPVSQAAWNSLINLCVDICKRYNFRLVYDGTPNGSLTKHNMFSNTQCPGNYLESKLPELAEKVNAILDGTEKIPEIPSSPVYARKIGDTVTINGVYVASNSNKKLNPARTTGTITKIVVGALNPYLLDNGNLGWVNDNVIISSTKTPSTEPAKQDINAIVQEVIAGKWGNGVERKNKLTSAGYDYNEIQKIVNNKLNNTSSSKKSNEEIAKEVIKGLWGNGVERKNKLTSAGYDYNEIQKIVNKK